MERPAPPVFGKREQIAVLLTLLVGVPLVFLFTRAVHDGIERARQTPLRVVVGDDRYEELVAGEGGFPHYVGNDKLAPRFTLRDREGNEWSLEEHRGKTLILNFWSITCPPCLEEMPSLETLAHLVEDWEDVEVVAISADDSFEDIEPVIPRDTRLTHLIDPGREVITGEFGTELFPETWIIDSRGVVRFRYDGARDWSSSVILDLIRQLR